MDVRESMLGGCLIPTLFAAAAGWFLWDRSPTAARVLSAVAALGVFLGIYMIVSLRLTARWLKEEEEKMKKKPQADGN
jgi:RsiW-degrading membrane proteinase PrsW (M82 family)